MNPSSEMRVSLPSMGSAHAVSKLRMVSSHAYDMAGLAAKTFYDSLASRILIDIVFLQDT
jgi:hypothetical protein